MTTNFTYWKSSITGQVYKFPSDMGIPAGKDWEAVHENTYIDYCHKNHLPL